ncbi:MAG: sigma-54 dependent transcriptional regulator [Nitrospirota bacterium]|nr:sigma-54 dependent transcriptional regulator [Nitrospirota bacterium]
MNKKILIVDDDPDIVLMLRDRLEGLGYISLHAYDGVQAMEVVEEEEPKLVLLDLQMPRMTGMEVLHMIKKHHTNAEQEHGAPRISYSLMPVPPPVIVMTAHGTIEVAVEAMKQGATDFLTKPLDVDHLSIVIQKAFEQESLKRQVAYLREEVESRYSTIVATTSSVKSLIDMAKRAASTEATILLLGESGTGKELFARSIHQWSPRAAMPFVVINCVALTDSLLENELFGHERGAYTGAHTFQKGKIEIADGGTVFLDEIGDMSPDLQTKLLRLLQDREFHRVGGTRSVRVNIRILAATNRDLTQAVKERKFRDDLFHRINVVKFSMPPLRERPDDIVPLANLFLQRYSKELGKSGRNFAPETVKVLRHYAWPGNVRELENAVSRALVLGVDTVIRPEQLGLDIEIESLIQESEEPVLYHEAMEQFGGQLIEQAIERARGNQTKAAEMLGLQRSYLARLLKQRGIETKDYREKK